MIRRFRVWSVAAVAGWMLVGVGWGQTVVPQMLAVQVEDYSGAPVVGAAVRAVEVGGTVDRVLRADAQGMVFVSFAPGARYALVVGAPGFKNDVRTVVGGAGAAEKLVVRLRTANQTGPGVEVTSMNGMVDPDPDHQVPISPSRVVPVGGAPGLKSRVVSREHGDTVYVLVFGKGDEVLSGLTDFAIANHVVDASFTGIGAVSEATTGWLDVEAKTYRGTVTRDQVEVLSLLGDVATFNGKPVVHAHVVLGQRDGSTVGGHLWEAKVNPTLEVFVTAHKRVLAKKLDEGSGMKLIDP